MLGFLDAVVSVADHVVTSLDLVLAPVAGQLAAPAAIILVTVTVRFLLLPVSYHAMRGQAAQARLQPQRQELMRRHAGQPARLHRELTALQQREGGGAAAGCLPLLIQLPFFSLMYRLFRSGSVGGRPNILLRQHLLGAPLGAHWLAVGAASGPGLVFIGVFALIGVVGWLSARLAVRPAPPASGNAARPAARNRPIAVAAGLVPYSTVVVAMFVPLAAGIYLLTTAAWTVAERAALRRRVQQAAPPGPAGG